MQTMNRATDDRRACRPRYSRLLRSEGHILMPPWIRGAQLARVHATCAQRVGCDRELISRWTMRMPAFLELSARAGQVSRIGTACPLRCSPLACAAGPLLGPALPGTWGSNQRTLRQTGW